MFCINQLLCTVYTCTQYIALFPQLLHGNEAKGRLYTTVLGGGGAQMTLMMMIKYFTTKLPIQETFGTSDQDQWHLVSVVEPTKEILDESYHETQQDNQKIWVLKVLAGIITPFKHYLTKNQD